MYKQYIGRTGKTYNVTEDRINGGGEGNIYTVLGEPDIVAKIYKEDRRTKDRENKLIVMMRHSLPNVTWPKDVVYDQQGNFMGYIMNRLVNTKNLNHIYATEIKGMTLRHKILVAYNLCAVIDSIHQLGQVCGDLNPQNICVNLDMSAPDACRITLVDSDSYHITDNNITYRCEVGLSNYIAPELQNKLGAQYDLKTAPLPTYTKETDLFAMAVHIFALFMNGCHPFSCAQMTSDQEESVVLPQPIDNIKSGFFPFAQKREGITIPRYAPAFESLPYILQNLFIKTFLEGYYDPSKRATAKEWMEALKSITDKSFYAQCENSHVYFRVYNKCPYCEVKQKMYEMRKINLVSNSNNNGTDYNPNETSDSKHKAEDSVKWILRILIIVLSMYLFYAFVQECVEYINNRNDYGYIEDIENSETVDYTYEEYEEDNGTPNIYY